MESIKYWVGNMMPLNVCYMFSYPLKINTLELTIVSYISNDT